MVLGYSRHGAILVTCKEPWVCPAICPVHLPCTHWVFRQGPQTATPALVSLNERIASYSPIGHIQHQSGAAPDAADDVVVVGAVQFHAVDGASLAVRVEHEPVHLVHHQLLRPEPCRPTGNVKHVKHVV